MLPYLLHGYPLTDRDALQLLLTCSTDTSSLLPLITCNMDIHFQLISKIITTSIFFIIIAPVYSDRSTVVPIHTYTITIVAYTVYIHVYIYIYIYIYIIYYNITSYIN